VVRGPDLNPGPHGPEPENFRPEIAWNDRFQFELSAKRPGPIVIRGCFSLDSYMKYYTGARRVVPRCGATLGHGADRSQLRRLRTPADSFRGRGTPQVAQRTSYASDQPSPMRQILARRSSLPSLCGPTTPSAQISPTSGRLALPHYAPAYRNWIEELELVLAASALDNGPPTVSPTPTLRNSRRAASPLSPRARRSAQPSLLSAISPTPALHSRARDALQPSLRASAGSPVWWLFLRGWRLYFITPDGFYKRSHQDGLTFTGGSGSPLRFADFPVRPGMEVTGAHVTKAKEGGWRMYFSEPLRRAYPNQVRGPACSALILPTS